MTRPETRAIDDPVAAWLPSASRDKAPTQKRGVEVLTPAAAIASRSPMVNLTLQ